MGYAPQAGAVDPWSGQGGPLGPPQAGTVVPSSGVAKSLGNAGNLWVISGLVLWRAQLSEYQTVKVYMLNFVGSCNGMISIEEHHVRVK
ncbi:hypothetical protein ROHU_021008 [Labeo rohita]|uniref:Uncharacterized protein n=1 Tax=Labeo rohita TaxID=84645 RepID=A0A498N2Y1_LABRO|nr:hypothetical protein ROHU_021008 [Labeo rohita]